MLSDLNAHGNRLYEQGWGCGVVQPETLFKLADGVSHICEGLYIYRQIVPDCMFPNANQMCFLIREPQRGTDYKSSRVNEHGNALKSGSHVVIMGVLFSSLLKIFITHFYKLFISHNPSLIKAVIKQKGSNIYCTMFDPFF